VTVRAGPSVRAVITADPWHIEFIGRHGRGGLAESQAMGTGPSGPLGFRTATGWAHATAAQSLERQGDAAVATVETSDPAGGTIDVRIEPTAPGVISLTATPDRLAGGIEATGMGFASVPDERYFGFGERSNAVEMSGLDVENYTSDGAVRPEDRAFPKPFLPPWAVSDRDDATYYPVPWLLSSAGHGVLIDNDERSFFRLESEDAGEWSLEAEAADLRMRFFAGPTPAKSLRRFTKATGRQPKPRAPWVFGPWFQTGQANQIPLEDEEEWTGILRAADAPVSAAETQMHYLPCGAHRGAEDYLAQRNAFFHSRGLAHLAYLNPKVCVSYSSAYNEAAGAGLFQQLPAGGLPYVYTGFVGGAGPAGFTVEPLSQIDFTADGSSDFYSARVDELMAAGHDGWMEDFGEWTPPDSLSADGTTGAEMHNRFPTTYHCAVKRIADGQPRPVARFNRSGWTGTARCADIVWGGDNTTVWDYDGLESAVKESLSMGLSGVSRWASDIGGYNTYGPMENLTPELLQRWIEFGSVSAVMRTKGGGLAFPSYDRPQIWDEENVGIWRIYAKLHTQLNPYLQAADRTYRRTGMPLMRHMALVEPGNSELLSEEDQFMFGPSFLAAPVVEPGATEKEVAVPRGTWIDFWRSVRFRDRDGAFVPSARARLVQGGHSATLPAPIEELPLLVKAGSVVPMLPADIDTLARYGKDDPEVVRLADRRRRLTLLAFPRGRSKSAIGPHGTVRSSESRAGWTLGIQGKPGTRYTLRASLGALRHQLDPCDVRLDGHVLQASYKPHARVLTAHFRVPAKTSALTVMPC
jgi:alpha-glucosidase (family GH31 glycosyl hydrolase)